MINDSWLQISIQQVIINIFYEKDGGHVGFEGSVARETRVFYEGKM